MVKLIPVIFKNMKYPSHIKADIHEISGNFYKDKLIVKNPYSLHTECSNDKRIFSSTIVDEFPHIKEAEKGNIPQLWFNYDWAKEFYEYIILLIGKNPPPDVLEIHPPFNDYCKSFEQFLDIFKGFYNEFKKEYPSTTIVIENRFGTRYKGGKFLLSTRDDILKFCEILSDKNNSDIDLKIVLDYPQLFSSEVKFDKNVENWMGNNPKQLLDKIISFNLELEKYRELIGGFHMWGKLKTDNKWKAHAGDLNTFFSHDDDLKHKFLSSVSSTFNDDIARYFVPEVISGVKHFHSIVEDMDIEKYGFTFDDDRLSKAIKKSFVFRLPEEYLRNRKSGFIELKGWEIQFCFGKKDDKEYMYCSCDHRMTNCSYVCVYDDGTSEELVDPLSDEDPNNTKDVDYRKRLNEIKRELCKIKPVNKYDF